MQKTLLHHPRLSVERRTGSEGPVHDPYGYAELHVTTPSGEVVLHEGLGTWLSWNGRKVGQPPDVASYEAWERALRNMWFPALTGYTVEQLERIHRRLSSRCRQCGNRNNFHTETGYPGEYFEVCDDCGKVHSSHFNESEII